MQNQKSSRNKTSGFNPTNKAEYMEYEKAERTGALRLGNTMQYPRDKSIAVGQASGRFNWKNWQQTP